MDMTNKCAFARAIAEHMLEEEGFLEKGRIREMGTHDELVANGGKYTELFGLQAKGYV